jgi:uncharacterized protein YoaH (UPF0181 family)
MLRVVKHAAGGRFKVWAEEEDRDEAGKALVALACSNKDQFSGRKAKAASLASIYEGVGLGRFGPGSYDTAPPLELEFEDEGGEVHTCPITWNVAASVIDTIAAKIFSLEKKKTAFVVTEGGWDVQRAAVMGARFVAGQMEEPQGLFPDAWSLWRHGARLAITATGACAVFFWSDPAEGKIVMELDDTLCMGVETSGMPYDGISSIYRVTWWDPAKLAAKFPDHEVAIMSAAERPDTVLQEMYELEDDSGTDEVCRVALVQGWTMARPKGRGRGAEMVPGKYCAAIQGATLDLADYKHQEPPCVFFVPQRHLAGVWGRTILERIATPARRVNEILAAIDECERRVPKNVLVYDPNTVPKETVANPAETMLIPFQGPPEKRPVWIPAPLISSQHFELLDRHLSQVFELPGMSQSHVASTREKGLSSGVAIRLVQNQVYERFAPWDSEFSRCVGPASARQIIRCARELQEEMGGFTSLWKGGEEGGFLREIDASVFEILDTSGAYRVEAESVSGSSNTPADRVQLAEELMQAGIITGEAYAAVLQHYDTYGEMGTGLARAEKQFVSRQIDSWLYDDIDDAERDYSGPERWMHQQTMLLEVGAAFIESKMMMHSDRTKPEVIRRQNLFHRFMAELQSQLADKTAAGAPAAPGQSGGKAVPVTGPAPGGVPAAPGVVGAGPGALAAPGTAPPAGPGGPLAA